MSVLKNKIKIQKKKKSNMKVVSLYLHEDIINELKEMSKFNEISINKIAAYLIHKGYEESIADNEKTDKEKKDNEKAS